MTDIIIQTEQSVLGAILLDNSIIQKITAILLEEDFYNKSHRIIFKAILEMETGIDVITLNSYLKKKGLLADCGNTAYLAYISSSVPTSANAVYYAKIVKQESKRRQLSALGQTLLHIEESDIEDLLSDTVKRLNVINEAIDEKEYVSVGDIVSNVATDLIDTPADKRGIPTYLAELDSNIGCIETADFWVIAARPGMGKTAMALSMARQQALHGYRVGIISMDMKRDKLVRRLLCHKHDTNLSHLIHHKGTEQEMKQIGDSAQELHKLPIFIADKGKVTLRNLDNWITNMVKRDKVNIIYIDYLQQIESPAGTREQEVATASRKIKALAKDLNTSIVALAQLNRSLEQRDNKRPRLSDLRESGQLEQDAEIILFPYRDEVHNPYGSNKYKPHESGTVEIGFGKTRDAGAVGSHVRVEFIKQSMRFANL